MIVPARRSIPAAALVAFLLAMAPSATVAATIDLHLDDEAISRDGDVVVITAEDGSEARIATTGDLTIDDRRIPTSARDRRDLRSYNQSLDAVEDHARELGVQAAGLAISAIGEALAALVTGDEEGAERRLESRSEPIEDHARALCSEIETLLRLQERIATRVPAFRPFAVIDPDDNDCEFDD